MIDFGAFDFEAHDWTYPVCWGLKWHAQSGDGLLYQTDSAPWNDHEKLAEDLLETLALLSQQNGVKHWYAHNLSNYDGLFLSAAACRRGWRQSAIVAGSSRVIEWSFCRGNSRVVCRDSYAIVSSALESAGRDFDLPIAKLFQKSDYRTSPRDWDLERRKQGCLTDCEVIMQLLPKLETYVEQWGGSMKATFSSIALSCIKANVDTALPVIPEKNNLFAEKACYGSRVEVYHHKPQYVMSEYDINSSYPHAMTKILPWEPMCKIDTPEGAQRALDNGEDGVFRCVVRVPDSFLPCLPYKLPCDACLSTQAAEFCAHDRISAVYFPYGEWEAWYPANELRYALTQGCSVRALECEVYSSKQPFAKFINDVYALKAQSKGALRETTKYILNGGWGKFHQQPEQTSLHAFATEAEVQKLAWSDPGKFTRLGKTSVSEAKFRWPKHTNLALASYILSGARIALHRYFIPVLETLAYGDADSVHCGLDALKQSDCIGLALGQIKECARDFIGEYYAPKLYRLKFLDGTFAYANKGFDIRCEACQFKTGAPCRCNECFDKVVAGQEVTKGRMQLIRTQLKKSPEKVLRRVDKKSWRGYSTKRKASHDGSTRPWHVQELLNLAHRKQLSSWQINEARP